MSVLDPRVLRRILEDLAEELKRWQVTTSDTLDEMLWHQRQGEEAVAQARHRAGIVMSQSEEDQYKVDTATAEVSKLISDCYQAIDDAKRNLQQAQNGYQEARTVLQHWNQKLQAALAWLSRAKKRLRLAHEELQAARSALASAEADLSYARSALRSCENSGYKDKDGNYHPPNCSSESAAVSAAEVAVSRAKKRVSAAQAEVNAAEIEVAQAEARVRCCETAIGYGKQAVQCGENALVYANQALGNAERSLEEAQAAQRSVNRAQKEATQEREAADLMAIAVDQAETLTSNAYQDFQNAEQTGGSAQRFSTMVSQELEERVESLIDLNRL